VPNDENAITKGSALAIDSTQDDLPDHNRTLEIAVR
jgi:hypothetical protein